MDEVKSLFVGNIDPFIKLDELQQLFEKQGTVEKIDLKLGFAFVYMNKEDGDNAIKELNNVRIGDKSSGIRVEWAKGSGSVKKREDNRKDLAHSKPNETLFVCNFDPRSTRETELEDEFSVFGPIVRVEIRKNFGFIQFKNVDDAVKAKTAMDGGKIRNRVIVVEYVLGTRSDSGYIQYYSTTQRSLHCQHISFLATTTTMNLVLHILPYN
eukprot:TRINITY_DN2387_c0_g1_i1.p1 TRINITY_DN2387_c0_g1~~TRINITY_DN2387_c0_g1_i1.p1  ORF type:complete len:211 (+),score=36.68 TRINITY_DN2387_c0_g1_i1:110-742(+)